MLLKNSILLAVLGLFGSAVIAQDNMYSTEMKLEKTHITNNKRLPDEQFQRELRHSAPWQYFLQNNGTWYVTFNEENQKPHRAYGEPIPVYGGTPQQKVENFIADKLQDFRIPTQDLVLTGIGETEKHIFVNYKQTYQGLEVLDSRFTARLTHDSKLILWGADVYNDIDVAIQPSLSGQDAIASASADITNTITNTTVQSDLKVLPIPYFKSMKYKLVYQVNVETVTASGIPSNWYTLVDANSGDVLYRQNMVMHCGGTGCTHGAKEVCSKDEFRKRVAESKIKAALPPGDIEVNLEATVYTNNPSGGTSVVGLGNLDLTVGGNNYQTDGTGFVSTSETGTQNATFSLEGQWGIVNNNGTTPSFTTSLTAGAPTTVTFDNDAMIEELCAYNNVNRIHDYHKTILPSFTGMDFQLPINVEITPAECNAFYNGSSINFYTSNATCYSLAMVADVVFHEYGHGINDKFYQSMGSNFSNGAMNEGYADVWAFAEMEDPILGDGNDPADPTASIRRYDTLGKVYPIDIVAEVHADGEIIAGAWWDLYLLLGNDMATTMDLFAQSFPGLQAATFNGNEGQAYTEVLLDVLMADDDDGDITNGTPNGVEIVEAFDMHGITLVSNAELVHTAVEEELQNTGIDIVADLSLNFPWTDYLDGVKCFYKINTSSTWNEITLSNTTGNTYEGQIPGQPEGTLVSYYLGAEDINNKLSAVVPVGAEADDPNLPYYILVDMDMVGFDDMGDNQADFGNWTAGLPSDNATTGQWELAIPLGSWGTPGDNSTMAAPDHQHTPNGDICYVTERGASASDGIGVADVDGGTTTLISSVIDLSGYDNPVVTYYRWYTNNPPTGANPNADWWQVAVSDDGGNTWVRIEDTKVSDRSWRRNAARVADYVNITNQFQIKYNVSDSLRPGQNLDGGSLVEGALDDFAIWDNFSDVGVEEVELNFSVYPNPSSGNLFVQMSAVSNEETTVKVLDKTGRMVKAITVVAGTHQMNIDLSDLSSGMYFVELQRGEMKRTKKVTKL